MIPILPTIISAIPSIIKLFDSDERKTGVKELTGQAIHQASKIMGINFNSGNDLLAHLNTNPSEVLKLSQLEDDTKIKMEKVGLLIIEAVNKTMQSESKSDHWLQYSWRPFIGINFGLYIGSLWLLPLFNKTPSLLDQNIIMAITAILGVASYFRGQEKVKKVK
jgi:hypothetical protein